MIPRQLALLGISVALVVSAAASLATAQAPTVLVRGISGVRPVLPINPLIQPSFPRANQLIFESLVSYGPDLRPRGQLAERWDVSSDGLVYTFFLHRDVRWHDGKPFDADDVVFTVRAALDERNRSRMRPYYRLKGQPVRVEKVDAHTVRFFLPAPAADFIYNLAQWNMMVPRHHLEGRDLATADFNARPVGTGPFRFVQLRQNDHVRMVANPTFHLGRPKVDVWIDRGFDDQQPALAALARGELDLLGLDSRFAVDIVRRLPHIKIYGYQPGWVYSVNMNLKASFFGDVRVRQALSYAIDRERIVRTYADDAPVAWSLIGPPSSWVYNPDVPKYPRDVQRARQLLREAGFAPGPGGVVQKNGRPFVFTLLIEGDASDANGEGLAAALQAAWRSIGVEARIERLDKRTLERTIFLGREFDAFLWYNGYNFEPDPSFYWHSQTSANNYDDPDLDKLIEQAASAPRPDLRKQLLDQIAVKIAKDAAFIPLYYFRRYIAAKDSVKVPEPSVADFGGTGVVYEPHLIQKAR